jgi:hypothetical protein
MHRAERTHDAELRSCRRPAVRIHAPTQPTGERTIGARTLDRAPPSGTGVVATVTAILLVIALLIAAVALVFTVVYQHAQWNTAVAKSAQCCRCDRTTFRLLGQGITEHRKG